MVFAVRRGIRITRLSHLFITLWILFMLTGLWLNHQRSKDTDRPLAQQQRIDWHDYEGMRRDRKRKGLGEQGKRAVIADESMRELERQMSLENGFNALLSDAMSVNRSLRDIRDKGCLSKKYLAKLPTVSVVIPYYNEHFSVLMRSVHSLVNRSPKALLKEIILVDDGSDREYLFAQLDQYVASNFDIVYIIRLKKHSGLIAAKLAGARKASAEVLVFLDSHIEANWNWLPPLLEPIALNKRTVVCPFIDVIDDRNFAYNAQDGGARGAFDWNFTYKRLPLLPGDLADKTKPFKSPVMAGGLFAMSAEFFWQLGGYDEGLEIWGGEQYELSFKIWMCGGEMYDAPCSRVGHIYRGNRNEDKNERQDDFVHRNFKRVAEVWMDEYRHALYERDKAAYAAIDAGDLSHLKLRRSRLQCKSFQWFMSNVAMDMLRLYPLVEPQPLAEGTIQSVGRPTLCVDALNGGEHDIVGVFACDHSTIRNDNQHWSLTWRNDLRVGNSLYCLDVGGGDDGDDKVRLEDCHEGGGNQYWWYSPANKRLMSGMGDGGVARCLELLPDTESLRVSDCQPNNAFMRWKFKWVNESAVPQQRRGIF